MTTIIALKSYLKELKDKGNYQVPTIKELADSIGMYDDTLHNIANNKIKQLSLDTASKIISEMRRRGFDMQIGDLLREE